MKADDLKEMQDGFLIGARKILLDAGKLRPVGFVVTLRKHVDRLLEDDWGLEFLDPDACLRDDHDAESAILIIDFQYSAKRLYHAIRGVFPQSSDALQAALELGQEVGVDDVYKRTTRAFLRATQLDIKDIIAVTMRQVCDRVDAFASIMQTEAWIREVDPSETADEILEKTPSLGQDAKSVEVIMSAMETYDVARMITVPIHREPAAPSAARDAGTITGFGEPSELLDSPDDTNHLEGRLVRFLKPLPEAS